MPTPKKKKLGWGGARPGAGRKRRPGSRAVPHRKRPRVDADQPLHMILYAERALGTLQRDDVARAVAAALGKASTAQFRVLRCRIGAEEIHLLVEASRRVALIRGAQGIGIRLARTINRVLRRSGRVFAERYRLQPIGNPKELREAMAQFPSGQIAGETLAPTTRLGKLALR